MVAAGIEGIRRNALSFVVLIGVVSLFADMTYEGVKRTALFADGSIPLLYSLAMAVDALAALLLGRLFDRWGLSVLVVVPLLSCFSAPLVFSGGAALAVAGTVLWGLGIGAQESIVRAAIAVMISPNRRGTAYGVFNAVYGIMWFAGSAILGILYDFAPGWLVGFSVGAQLIAVPILFAIRHTGRPRAGTGGVKP